MVDATKTDGGSDGSLRLKLDRVTQACIARGFTAQTVSELEVDRRRTLNTDLRTVVALAS